MNIESAVTEAKKQQAARAFAFFGNVPELADDRHVQIGADNVLQVLRALGYGNLPEGLAHFFILCPQRIEVPAKLQTAQDR